MGCSNPLPFPLKFSFPFLIANCFTGWGWRGSLPVLCPSLPNHIRLLPLTILYPTCVIESMTLHIVVYLLRLTVNSSKSRNRLPFPDLQYCQQMWGLNRCLLPNFPNILISAFLKHHCLSNLKITFLSYQSVDTFQLLPSGSSARLGLAFWAICSLDLASPCLSKVIFQCLFPSGWFL